MEMTKLALPSRIMGLGSPKNTNKKSLSAFTASMAESRRPILVLAWDCILPLKLPDGKMADFWSKASLAKELPFIWSYRQPAPIYLLKRRRNGTHLCCG